MIFGVALASEHGTAGAIFYVAHHITIQTALFLITGLVERLGGTTSLDRLGGLAAASPVLAILFFTSAMNLSGIPPLSGFPRQDRPAPRGPRAGHADGLGPRGGRHRDQPAHALRPHEGLEPGVLAQSPRESARDEELDGTAGSEEPETVSVSVGQGAAARTDSRGEALATGPWTSTPTRRGVAGPRPRRPHARCPDDAVGDGSDDRGRHRHHARCRAAVRLHSAPRRPHATRPLHHRACCPRRCSAMNARYEPPRKPPLTRPRGAGGALPAPRHHRRRAGLVPALGPHHLGQRPVRPGRRARGHPRLPATLHRVRGTVADPPAARVAGVLLPGPRRRVHPGGLAFRPSPPRTP